MPPHPIPPLPAEIAGAATPEAAAARLGAWLGLAGPAPAEATRRALADPRFALALAGARNLPGMRDALLAGALAVPPAAAAPPRGAARTAAKAAGAVLKWGMDGLRPAAPWVIERRLAACAACPNQAPAPETLVYRGARVVAGKDARICTLCGCLTNTKAAISTELCPGRDPADPARSRWGEPWTPPEEHPEGPW
jgi:hypothetical protein